MFVINFLAQILIGYVCSIFYQLSVDYSFTSEAELILFLSPREMKKWLLFPKISTDNVFSHITVKVALFFGLKLKAVV